MTALLYLKFDSHYQSCVLNATISVRRSGIRGQDIPLGTVLIVFFDKLLLNAE